MGTLILMASKICFNSDCAMPLRKEMKESQLRYCSHEAAGRGGRVACGYGCKFGAKQKVKHSPQARDVHSDRSA